MRHDDCALSSALERRENLQEKCVITIFRRWNAKSEAAKWIMLCIDAIAPRFAGEWRIGNHEIEGLESTFFCKVRVRECIAFPDFSRRTVVEEHVHFREGPGRKIVLLPVDRKIFSGRAFGFVMSFEEQRPRPTRGIVNGLRPTFCATYANHLRHDARNFCRSVK